MSVFQHFHSRFMNSEVRSPAFPAVASVVSGEEAKCKLRARGITLSAWAKEHDFPYPIVSGVVRGVIKGNFGVAHDVAVALGMKVEERGDL